MTNAQALIAALDQGDEYPFHHLPFTIQTRRWLRRPCQLPIPFPCLGPTCLQYHLDSLLLDYIRYRLSLAPDCQLHSPPRP